MGDGPSITSETNRHWYSWHGRRALPGQPMGGLIKRGHHSWEQGAMPDLSMSIVAIPPGHMACRALPAAAYYSQDTSSDPLDVAQSDDEAK